MWQAGPVHEVGAGAGQQTSSRDRGNLAHLRCGCGPLICCTGKARVAETSRWQLAEGWWQQAEGSSATGMAPRRIQERTAGLKQAGLIKSQQWLRR